VTVVDRELLEKARTAGAAFQDADRRLRSSRADYHTAIRRLHLAGASLREIADELSLSHQRVQQIVDGAGGTWWRRIWRTRNATRDLICTWCGRPDSEVTKLIAGPDVFICESCIEAAERAMRGLPEAGLKRATGTANARCAFCSRRRSQKRAIVVAPSANVCDQCLRACRDILDGRAA
jgi:hypothetical protein